MEALVYDDSPLADYLEGDASPFESTPAAPSTPPRFAPTGLPRIRDRLYALRNAATSVAGRSDERFLEKFRYIIIASQLLSDEPKLHSRPPHDDSSLDIALSIRGALLTTGLSFFLPWLVYWVRAQSRSYATSSWTQILFYILVIVCAVLATTFALRRQYARYVRQSATSAASKFVTECHGFDATVSEALRYVQEIEVVARGYQINPLPPISRLEDGEAGRYCRELRCLMARSLTTCLTQFIHFHNELQPFIDLGDLNSYYHIYEISTEDFSGAVNFANDLSKDAQESLKQLRFLFTLNAMARKLLLIDLLTLRPKSNWNDAQSWRRALRILQTMTADMNSSTGHLLDALKVEDQHDSDLASGSQDADSSPASTDVPVSPSRQQSQAQIRRFESISSGVRSLNAKVRIARDDLSDLIANDANEATLGSTIARHYDHMGSELRNLLSEWERGRSIMLSNVTSEGRLSHPPSGARSPISPSPSLGGVTVVDGGPADALRLLTGDDELAPALTSDVASAEIFEAVARPARKRMSLALSREEKMAKLQEDRKKRATLQEQADTTTNMLRELQMVIKHRPLTRPDSRVTSV